MCRFAWMLLLVCAACGDLPSNTSSNFAPGVFNDRGVAGSMGGAVSGGGGTAGGTTGSSMQQTSQLVVEKLPGSFACDPASTLRDLGPSDGDVTRMDAADFNKDGKDDLLLGSLADDLDKPLDGFGVHLLLSSKGGYELETNTGLPCGGTASECGLDLVVEDHDKDGNLDVLAVNPTGSKLVVYKGNGKGGLSQLGDDIPFEANPADYRFWDTDHDGDSDLVLELAQGCDEPSDAMVRTAKECASDDECTGGLVCRGSFYVNVPPDHCLPAACAGMQVLENKGMGNFVLGAMHTATMSNTLAQPHTGDVNGDGVLDLFNGWGELRWHVAKGNSFEAGAAIRSPRESWSKAFDIDNDGRDELIYGNTVLWSDASGKFLRATVHSFQTNAERLTTFRIDETHALVASGGPVKQGNAEQWSVSVSIFEGAQLKKHFDLCVKDRYDDPVGTVAAADIDGDGKRELIVGGYKKDVIQVYDGAFSSP